MTTVNTNSNGKGGRPVGSYRIAILDNTSKIAIDNKNINSYIKLQGFKMEDL